jgi:hypothetical protein
MVDTAQTEEKRLPEPHDMQLPMSHWQRLRPPTFWEKHTLLPWIIFFGGFAILALTITAYALKYFNQQTDLRQQHIGITASPTLRPTITETTIPADWKTYESSELGISFKYPPDWYIYEEKTTGPKSLRIQNYDPNTTPPTSAKGSYLVVIREGFQAKTNEELQNELANRAVADSTFGPVLILNEKQFTINGYTAYQREERYPDYPIKDVGLETYMLDGKGKNIIINPGLDIERARTYYDQILSTITFISSLTTEGDNPKITVTMTPVTAEGEFCGGKAANIPQFQCPTGYYCKLDGDYPDASGKCVKN